MLDLSSHRVYRIHMTILEGEGSGDLDTVSAKFSKEDCRGLLATWFLVIRNPEGNVVTSRQIQEGEWVSFDTPFPGWHVELTQHQKI